MAASSCARLQLRRRPFVITVSYLATAFSGCRAARRAPSAPLAGRATATGVPQNALARPKDAWGEEVTTTTLFIFILNCLLSPCARGRVGRRERAGAADGSPWSGRDAARRAPLPPSLPPPSPARRTSEGIHRGRRTCLLLSAHLSAG